MLIHAIAAGVVAAAVLAAVPARAADTVLAEWNFARGLEGWAPGPTARATVGGGALVVRTDGKDPILISPPVRIDARDNDVLEARMSASRDGDIQWFWRRTTEGPYGGFNPQEQRVARVIAGKATRAYRAHVLWAGAGPVIGLRFDLPEGAPGVYRIESLRVLRPDASEAARANWTTDGRTPVATKRIDVAKQAPPETHPVASDYTVAMWYFAAWEPEYTWDGWGQVGERSPWRIPLLYDSADPAMEYNGIRFYRASNPRVVDWHVHWLREHAVNLMLWDWYPQVRADGTFDPTFFGNRALEIGFLGKPALGGPPAAGNRFAGKIRFATMWTNHAPGNKIAKGLIEYIVDQFFSQPNYYRIDGKPLLPVWSPGDLVAGAGGREQARAVLDGLRSYAQSKGFPGVYIAAVNGIDTRAQARELGFDGVMAYNYLGLGGYESVPRRVQGRVIEDHFEDFRTQTMPGQERTWQRMAREFGRDYLLATTPMQNWEPTLRPTSYVIRNGTPDDYREMLRHARRCIDEQKLRPFVSVEAFNEWLEGSYVEPSTQWGFGWLEALRDVLGKPTAP